MAIAIRSQMTARYVLVTAARDEAQFIGATIASVLRQTIRPLRWVIVSDGSNDGTDDVVAAHAAEHDWIELIRLPRRQGRHFGGKADAVNTAYQRLEHLAYEFVGNLDGDVSFDPDYFEFLIDKLRGDSRLGVVGTRFVDPTVSYDYRYISLEHVSGPCQFFRRGCFEEMHGYRPSPIGGVDDIAVITARMNGWRTRTFTERCYAHNRGMGSCEHGLLWARFKAGSLDYALGGHPLWEVCRTAYQVTKKPYGVGALMLFAGFTSAALRRLERPVSPAFIDFHRREQMERLRAFAVGPMAVMRRHGGSSRRGRLAGVRQMWRTPMLRMDRRTLTAFVTGVCNSLWVTFQTWLS